MNSVKEYISKGEQLPVGRVHREALEVKAVDIMKHVLDRNAKSRFGLATEGQILTANNRIAEAVGESEKIDTKKLYRDKLKSFSLPANKFQTRLDEEGEEFDVEAFLEEGGPTGYRPGEKIFRANTKAERRKEGVLMLIPLAVPGREAGSSYMKRVHEHAYSVAIECESKGEPCKILGVLSIKYKIRKKTYILDTSIVIKDWEDPIFPGIWGLIMSNEASNILCFAMSYKLVGTSEDGAGGCLVYKGVPKAYEGIQNVVRVKSPWIEP